jgi:hypothetical protein
MITPPAYVWVDVRVQSTGNHGDFWDFLPYMMASGRVSLFVAASVARMAELAPRDGVAISIRKVLP